MAPIVDRAPRGRNSVCVHMCPRLACGGWPGSAPSTSCSPSTPRPASGCGRRSGSASTTGCGPCSCVALRAAGDGRRRRPLRRLPAGRTPGVRQGARRRPRGDPGPQRQQPRRLAAQHRHQPARGTVGRRAGPARDRPDRRAGVPDHRRGRARPVHRGGAPAAAGRGGRGGGGVHALRQGVPAGAAVGAGVVASTDGPWRWPPATPSSRLDESYDEYAAASTTCMRSPRRA